ncbi:hypothetical protein [Eubacterium aggregans]|uniref:hypothetical protein n=1 Tax=Eubacterium aggregans TaxID=81409 RepID=UPI003F2A2C8B
MRINFEGRPDELRALVSTIVPGAGIVDAIVEQVANNIASDDSFTEEELIKADAGMRRVILQDVKVLPNPYISMHR